MSILRLDHYYSTAISTAYLECAEIMWTERVESGNHVATAFVERLMKS